MSVKKENKALLRATIDASVERDLRTYSELIGIPMSRIVNKALIEYSKELDKIVEVIQKIK